MRTRERLPEGFGRRFCLGAGKDIALNCPYCPMPSCRESLTLGGQQGFGLRWL